MTDDPKQPESNTSQSAESPAVESKDAANTIPAQKKPIALARHRVIFGSDTATEPPQTQERKPPPLDKKPLRPLHRYGAVSEAICLSISTFSPTAKARFAA